MALNLNEVKYGELLRVRQPRQIETEEDFDRWVAVCEEIDMRPSSTSEE